MSAISKNLPTPPDNFSTQLSAGISDSDLTIPLNSVSGLSEDEGIGVLFKKDSDGEIVAGSIEFVHWTGISGSSLTLDDTDDRGITGSDSGAQAYSTGDYFEVWVTKYYYDSQKLGFEVEHNQDGSHSDVLMNKIYPIGSVYINADDDTDPAELLGFGTWEAIAAGRVLVGQDTGDTDFDTLGENYGEKEHSLTTDEIPSHYHTVNPPSTSTDNDTHNHGVYVSGNRAASGSAESVPVGSGGTVNTANDTHNHTVDIPQFNSGNAGGGSAHNNIQPSLVVKIWKRTA